MRSEEGGSPRWRALALAIAYPLPTVGIGLGVGAIFGITAGVVATLLGAAVVGAVSDRWWILGAPVVWGSGYLGVLRLIDLATGACHVCGEDEDWSNWPIIFAIFYVAPLALASFTGVGAWKAAEAISRRRRSRDALGTRSPS